MRVFNRFSRSTSGATAIEYGLIAALIAVALIGVIQALGIDMNDVFGSLHDAITGAGG